MKVKFTSWHTRQDDGKSNEAAHQLLFKQPQFPWCGIRKKKKGVESGTAAPSKQPPLRRSWHDLVSLGVKDTESWRGWARKRRGGGKGGHGGRGGVTSKPTSKGINNCFCWFCCCDTDRRSSKWRAGSFDFRQPSWRGLLLSAAEQRERGPLIKVLFVLIFPFAQGRPTEREGSYWEVGRCPPPGDNSFPFCGLKSRRRVQHPAAVRGESVKGRRWAREGVEGVLMMEADGVLGQREIADYRDDYHVVCKLSIPFCSCSFPPPLLF